MSTQNLYTPRVPNILHQEEKSISPIVSQEIYSVNRFLSECIVNILKGNLQNVQRYHGFRYKKIALISQADYVDTEMRNVDIRKVFTTGQPLPHLSIITCLDMEQCVFVPVSLLNPQNTKSSELKVDIPKYQPEQTPSSHVDLLKRILTKSCLPGTFHWLINFLRTPFIKLPHF